MRLKSWMSFLKNGKIKNGNSHLLTIIKIWMKKRGKSVNQVIVTEFNCSTPSYIMVQMENIL